MKVKIKKLHPKAIIPKYAKQEDAGLDLTAVGIEYTKDYVSYKTGLAFEIPEGFVGLIFPRSSNSKKDLLLCNSVGVLDSGFRGEVEFRYKWVGHCQIPNIGSELKNLYNIEDRIGEIMIIPYPQIGFEQVVELSETERGFNGFGSTNLEK